MSRQGGDLRHAHEWEFLGHTKREDRTGPLYVCRECGTERFNRHARSYFEIESDWEFNIGRLWFVWRGGKELARWRDRIRCLVRGHDTRRNGTTDDPERQWWCPTCGKVWPSHGHVARKMEQKPSGRGEI